MLEILLLLFLSQTEDAAHAESSGVRKTLRDDSRSVPRLWFECRNMKWSVIADDVDPVSLKLFSKTSERCATTFAFAAEKGKSSTTLAPDLSDYSSDTHQQLPDATD